MNSEKFSIISRLRSFHYAFRGLSLLIKKEHNARIHLIAAVLAACLGIFLIISLSEWLIITIVIGNVFICELINTAVENLSDIIEPGKSQKIRNIKDYTAAAVFISALISAIVGAIIFIPKIIKLL
jgi:diacylglycerol kinase (ATP)